MLHSQCAGPLSRVCAAVVDVSTSSKGSACEHVLRRAVPAPCSSLPHQVHCHLCRAAGEVVRPPLPPDGAEPPGGCAHLWLREYHQESNPALSIQGCIACQPKSNPNPALSHLVPFAISQPDSAESARLQTACTTLWQLAASVSLALPPAFIFPARPLLFLSCRPRLEGAR